MSASSLLETLAAVRPALSVRRHFVLLALIVTLPLLALAFFVSDRVATTEREATKAALLSNAWSLADSISREIDKHIAVAVTLSSSRFLRHEDLREFYRRAQETLAAVPDSWILVVDPSGQQLLNTLQPFGAPLPTRPLREAEQRALATGEPQVSNVFQGIVAQRPIALAVVPVFKDGSLRYFIDVGLTTDRFRAVLQEQKYPLAWDANIIDRDGNLLASKRDPQDQRTGKPASQSWRAAIARAPSGLSETTWIDGEPGVAAYAPTAQGWTVGVAIERSTFDAPARQTRWLLLAAGLTYAGLSLLLAFDLARHFTRGIHTLQRTAISLAEEKPVSLQATGVRECDELSATLAKTSSLLSARLEERKRAEAALARRVNELAALSEFTEQNFRSASLAAVHEAALDAILKATGCDRAAVLMFDKAGVMRFVAWRGLPDDYRKAVDGHSPWTIDVPDPEPLLIEDIDTADLTDPIRRAVQAEGIGALAFIPIVTDGRLIGKFMTYYDAPHVFSEAERGISVQIARRLGFRIAHRRAEESRRIAEQELRESESRLTSILEQMPFAVGLSDCQGQWVLTNSAMRRLFPQAIPSRDPERWHASAADGCPLEPVEWPSPRALRGETVSPGVDFVRTEDACESWIRVAAAPFLNAEGRLSGAVTVVQDITALKRAEHAEKMLGRELQHRTNNLLAVIQAIAQRSLSGNIPLEEARRTFESRLQALARTHHQLLKANRNGVSLDDLVRSELEPFSSRTRIEGSNVMLDPQHAHNLSLAVHELATNAVKYGSLSDPRGQVDVRWEIAGNGKGNVLMFQWQERGGPVVVSPTRQGFGTSLLKAVSSQIRMDYAPEGLSCQLELSLGNAAAAASRH